MSSRSSLVICFALVMISASTGLAGTYTEDFTTNTMKDTLNTTARWDTIGGGLGMFPFVPTLASNYNTPGSAFGIAVSGDLAFIADAASGLQVIDITDTANPALAGTYNTPFFAHDVAVAGNVAYVADLDSGLVVINISDPTVPTLLGSYDIAGSARSVTVAGDLAYVAGGSSGLFVFDILDPTSPTLLGSYNTPFFAYDVAVDGDLAFVADGNSGLLMINVIDPTTPTLTGTFDTPGSAEGVAVDGNHAFVADGSSGLQVIDITDPTTPTFLGTYDTPGTARAVTVGGDVVYVADDTGGLLGFDITDPMNPTLNGIYDTSGNAFDVTVDGEHAFVADQATGLQVIHISDHTDLPALLGWHDTPSTARGVNVAGDLAFVAETSFMGGLKVYDITDPTNPALAGFYPPPFNSSIYDVAVVGDLAVCALNASGLVVVDISDPVNPDSVGSFITTSNPFNGARNLAVDGDLVFIGFVNNGCWIVDISDPTSPDSVGAYNPGIWVQDVALDGDYAFVADWQFGLHVVDISDPTNPTTAGTYAAPDDVSGIAVAGDLAFLVGQVGIQLIDISDPTIPTLIGAYDPLNYAPNTIGVAGDFVFATESKVDLIDISDPTNPTLSEGQLILPNAGSVSVEMAGEFAFTAQGTIGLVAYQVFQHEVIITDNVGQSLALDDATDTILRARIASTQSLDVTWELSANGGTNFDPFTPDAGWTTFTNLGTDILWRSTHTWAPPGGNPTVSDVTVEWLNEFGSIASISDVPDDQGGLVNVMITRSGYDFADETSFPVTGYNIYRRIDGGALITGNVRTSVVEDRQAIKTPSGEKAWPLPNAKVVSQGNDFYAVGNTNVSSVPSFPPGTWKIVGTAFGTQTDSYIIETTTETDSSASGTGYSNYLVTTHTTTPSQWFISSVDSGYSVDNIAPGVPIGVAAAYNTGSGNQLSWDANTELDFQYYRVYRDSDPGFIPSIGNFVEGTASNSWTDTENDGGGVYYKVTAVDDADNESDPASPATATSVRQQFVPKTFALHQNAPNPFNPTTTIRYDVASGGIVTLQIFDVSGRLVQTLINESQQVGQKEVTWNGRNDAGQHVATGTYFYRLTAPGFAQTKRMVLLK